mmetsp:Transcript_3506/g.5211  ORF Transcript_3506/g.5211 Transcript_3506/m.5211 type:complete len:164 (-) Transcript_3506:744-1235(-)
MNQTFHSIDLVVVMQIVEFVCILLQYSIDLVVKVVVVEHWCWQQKRHDDDDDGGDFVRSLSLLSKMAQTKEEKSQQWNLKFQQTIDRLSASANAPLREKIIANVELLHLAQDFIGAAKTYGRIIISEVYLNESEKTIKPVNVGGQAGGEKYIVHGANSASVLL